MTPYANTFKDERIDELNYENTELKDIIDSLQNELKECESDFNEVVKRLETANKILIKLHKNHQIPESTHTELKEVLTNHPY